MRPAASRAAGLRPPGRWEDASRTRLGRKGVKSDPDFPRAARPVLSVAANVSQPEPANELPGAPRTAPCRGVAGGCHSAERNDTRAGGGSEGTPGKEREKKQIKPRQGVKRCPAPLGTPRPPRPLPPGVGSGSAGPAGRERTSLKRNPAGGEEAEAQRKRDSESCAPEALRRGLQPPRGPRGSSPPMPSEGPTPARPSER